MFGVQGRTIASVTLRATMGRKRALLFALPPLILIVVTLLIKLAHPSDPSWPSQILGVFGFSVVLPLTALIIGTSVLGAEVDDGSIVQLLATPVPRSVVIGSKYVVATVLTMIFVAIPELLAGLIATGGVTKLAIGLFVGTLAGSVMYTRTPVRELAWYEMSGTPRIAGAGNVVLPGGNVAWNDGCEKTWLNPGFQRSVWFGMSPSFV